MSIKLEDMLTVVKPPPQALDLFRTKIKCKEDFDKAFEKVPEYKIRPEKVNGREARKVWKCVGCVNERGVKGSMQVWSGNDEGRGVLL